MGGYLHTADSYCSCDVGERASALCARGNRRALIYALIAVALLVRLVGRNRRALLVFDQHTPWVLDAAVLDAE